MSETKKAGSGNTDPHSQSAPEPTPSTPTAGDSQETKKKPAVKAARFAARQELGGSGNTDPHSQP